MSNFATAENKKFFNLDNRMARAAELIQLASDVYSAIDAYSKL
jgi:hypothetical protein